MMKKWLLAALCLVAVTGCSRYNRMEDHATTPAPIVVGRQGAETSLENTSPEETAQAYTKESNRLEDTVSTPAPIVVGRQGIETVKEETTPEETTIKVEKETAAKASVDKVVHKKPRVKVKGIYISAFVAGTDYLMNDLIEKIDETEINAVVIDLKNDEGRITCTMDSPLVKEIGAEVIYIRDIEEMIQMLKEHGIYVIARVVAFRDPYLAEKKPEWSLKLADGSSYRDSQGLAWVNPYKKEVWDYLVEVSEQAKELGFDEVQFDYIRFSTEKGIGNVVYDEADTRGRSKTDIITEFIDYVYKELQDCGIYVSADVFGAIIISKIDAESVGQIYGEMSKHLDYICPMIYPSHYSDGNFGILHPDMEPYNTIYAALQGSSKELKKYSKEGENQALVRPWLQGFTASYLKNYIKYGPEEIRAQIQAVYDAGYDEWILWDASCKYSWEGLRTPEEAVEEEKQIEKSRAAKALQDTMSNSVKLPGKAGAAPEISQMPQLPGKVAPAGPTQPEYGDFQSKIPQMQME